MAEAYLRSAALALFGHTPERSLEQLAHPPAVEAVRAAGLRPTEVDAIVGGSYASGVLTAQRVARGLGLSDRPIINVENACASSSFAANYAVTLVRRGVYRNVLVLGVEQLSRSGSSLVPLNDDDPEVSIGLIMPALYAMRAQRYMLTFGATAADLAAVSVKSHAAGALNPIARYRRAVSLEEVLTSRMIADPLTLLQCCAGGDGAGALVIGAEPGDGPAVRVAASAVSAGRETSGPRDMAASELTRKVADQGYAEAGVGPQDLDVVELHDAFTIGELIYTEALGLCPPGGAPALLHSGATSIGGRCPVNPSGGLLSRGHPVGATGVAQLAEVFWQLRGQAGPRQTAGRRVGLTHTTGGGIAGYDNAACAVHILIRE